MIRTSLFKTCQSGSNKANILQVCLAKSHERCLGFHFLSLALNTDSNLVCFKSNGNVSQHFGPK